MSDTALHQAVIGGDDKEYLSFVLADELKLLMRQPL